MDYFNEFKKIEETGILITVKTAVNTYSPSAFSFDGTYSVKGHDVFYTIFASPSIVRTGVEAVKCALSHDCKDFVEKYLPATVGETVSMLTFKKYYKATVIPNWQQFRGGADFTVYMGGKSYKLEAKGTWSYGNIKKLLEDGHTRNLKSKSGYVTCFLQPRNEIYVGWYSAS